MTLIVCELRFDVIAGLREINKQRTDEHQLRGAVRRRRTSLYAVLLRVVRGCTAKCLGAHLAAFMMVMMMDARV